MKNYDVILVFAFGDSLETNQKLIEEVGKFRLSAPIFSQKSLDQALHDAYPERTIIIAEQADDRISTYEIAEQFATLAVKKKWMTACIIAAEQQIWRCQRDIQKNRMFYCAARRIKTGYSPHDPQLWVRNCYIWWLREMIIRMLPFNLYKAITG